MTERSDQVKTMQVLLEMERSFLYEITNLSLIEMNKIVVSQMSFSTHNMYSYIQCTIITKTALHFLMPLMEHPKKPTKHQEATGKWQAV